MTTNFDSIQTLKSREVCDKFSKSVSYETLVGGTTTTGRECGEALEIEGVITRRTSVRRGYLPEKCTHANKESLFASVTWLMRLPRRIQRMLLRMTIPTLAFLLSLNISESWAVTCNVTPDPNNEGKYSLEVKGDSGGNVFNGCGWSGWREFSSKITSATLDKNITSIGDSAFSEASSLTSITIPDSVTSIGVGAFYNAKSLTSITIPDSVKSIGDHAFQNASSLKSITIPKGVTSIGDQAFQGTSSLTSITIPDSVTSIGDAAFAYTGLTSITIPDSVTSIGWGAFGGATGLKSITIPKGVTYIGDYAFAHTGLTSITIPDSVTSIGASAFYNANGLKSIIIPDDIYTENWAANVFQNLPEGTNIVCQGDLNTCYEKLAKYIPESKGGTCTSGCISPDRIIKATDSSQCSGNYGWSGAGCARKDSDGKVPCVSGFVEWDNQCWSEYPFAKKRWTPAEANEWLHDGNDNFVVITFKK